MTLARHFAKGFRRPRVFYGWWIVATGALITGLGSINMLSFTVFFLPMSRELGLSRAVTSLVHSSSRLEGGMIGPLSGWAIDRLGVRRMLAFGSIMGGLGLILLGAVVHNLLALFLVYGLVIGVGFNVGFFPAVLAAINSWFIRRRTMAMGIVNATWGAVAFIMVPLLASITLHFGWRVAAIVAGSLVMATAIPAILVMRNAPETMGLLPDGKKADGPSVSSTGSTVIERPRPSVAFPDVPVRQALKTPAFWLVTIAANLRMIGYSVLLVHFVPVLVWKGLSEQAAANLIGLWSLLIVPSSLITGLLGDLWDKRLLLSFGMLLGAAVFFSLAVVSHPAYVYLSVLMLSVFDNLGVLNSSLLGDYFGRRSFATLRGILSGVGSLGVATSPVYAGWVWDTTESYKLALIPFAAAFVVSAIIYMMLPRRRAVPITGPTS